MVGNTCGQWLQTVKTECVYGQWPLLVDNVAPN